MARLRSQVNRGGALPGISRYTTDKKTPAKTLKKYATGTRVKEQERAGSRSVYAEARRALSTSAGNQSKSIRSRLQWWREIRETRRRRRRLRNATAAEHAAARRRRLYRYAVRFSEGTSVYGSYDWAETRDVTVLSRNQPMTWLGEPGHFVSRCLRTVALPVSPLPPLPPPRLSSQVLSHSLCIVGAWQERNRGLIGSASSDRRNPKRDPERVRRYPGCVARARAGPRDRLGKVGLGFESSFSPLNCFPASVSQRRYKFRVLRKGRRRRGTNVPLKFALRCILLS